MKKREGLCVRLSRMLVQDKSLQ